MARWLVLGFGIFAAILFILYYRHLGELELIADNKRQIERFAAETQQRVKFAEFVKGASDRQLESLYTDCEREISDLIEKSSKPAAKLRDLLLSVSFPSHQIARRR